MSEATPPGASGEAQRLIQDLVDAVAEGAGSGVTFDRTERAALSAYVAGLEAEVARLREWSHLQAQDIITLGHMAGGAHDVVRYQISTDGALLLDVQADRVTVLECTTVLPTPDMLRARLLRDGWTERPARHPGASIYEIEVRGFDGPFSLVLPHGEAIGAGWLSSVVGALRTLAGLEDRPDGVRDRPPGDIAAEIVAEHGRRGSPGAEP